MRRYLIILVLLCVSCDQPNHGEGGGIAITAPGKRVEAFSFEDSYEMAAAFRLDIRRLDRAPFSLRGQSSRPARCSSLMTVAMASVNCSRYFTSIMQVSRGRPHMLMSNQRGRGQEPVTVAGSTRSFVMVSMSVQ